MAQLEAATVDLIMSKTDSTTDSLVLILSSHQLRIGLRQQDLPRVEGDVVPTNRTMAPLHLRALQAVLLIPIDLGMAAAALPRLPLYLLTLLLSTLSVWPRWVSLHLRLQAPHPTDMVDNRCRIQTHLTEIPDTGLGKLLETTQDPQLVMAVCLQGRPITMSEPDLVITAEGNLQESTARSNRLKRICLRLLVAAACAGTSQDKR